MPQHVRMGVCTAGEMLRDGGGCTQEARRVSLFYYFVVVFFLFLSLQTNSQFTHEHTLLLLLFQWSLDTSTSSSLACEMAICVHEIKTN